MLQLETQSAGARAAALAGAPIDVRSALNRTASAPVSPTLGGRPIDPAAPAAPAGGDDESPDWPPADIEEAMSAEAAERDGGGRPAPARRARREEVDTLDGGPLPPLSEMLKLIPADLQEQLDDLFRAKFQAVKRVPAAVLKVNQEEERKPEEATVDVGGEAEVADAESDEED